MQTISAQGVSSQPTEGAESGAQDVTGGGQPVGSAETEGVQPDGQGNADDGVLGSDDLPPELLETRKKLLQDYHQKTQKIAAREREIEHRVKDLEYSDGLLKQVMNEEWFKKAYESEKARRMGHAVPEIDENTFETLKSDPKAFQEYIRKYAESIVESKMGNKLPAVDRELRELKLEREKERMAGKYSDFRDALDAGHLDKYLKSGRDYETAYALYTLNDGKSRDEEKTIEAKARQVLQQRRAGAIGGAGATSVKGERVIKARDWHDAIEKGLAAAEKGETNFRFER